MPVRLSETATPTSPRPASASARTAGAPARTSEPGSFQRALGSLGAQVDRGERMVRAIAEGGAGSSLSAGDMIALQAGIYRYGEAVDLCAKIVDRAGNTAKTVLQGQ